MTARQRTLGDSLVDDLKAEAGANPNRCPMRAIPQPLRRALYLNALDHGVPTTGLSTAAKKRGAQLSENKIRRLRAGSTCDGCVCEADA